MRTSPIRPLVLAILTLSLAACSSDSTAPEADEDAYLGAWTATSFAVFGMDAIAQGMTLSAVLTETTYAFTVTDDAVGVCGDDAPPDCTTTGSLAATATQITIDPGTEDAVTFDWSVSGNTMTFTGSIDGISAVIVWARAN